MFSRNLTKKEIEMIGIIEGFVREKHAQSTAHENSLFFLNELRKALKKRSKEIRELPLPEGPQIAD